MKTEKDLSSTQRHSYLKALSAIEVGNLDLVVSLMGQMIAEEPEFLAGRKLLREAEVRRAWAGKSSFLGLSGWGLSLGKSKAQRSLETGDWAGAINAAEKALETDPMGTQPNKDLFNAAESVAKEAREKIKNELQPAVESAPAESKPEAEVALFDASERMRTYEVIARFALETIALDPKNSKARHEVAKYLMDTEQYDEAAKVYEEILRATSKDREARDRAKEAARQLRYPPLIDPFPLPRKDRTMHEESSEMPRGDQTVREETIEELARKVYEAHEAGKPDQESARKLADLYYNREDYGKSLEYYRYLSGLAKGTDPGLLRKIGDTEVRWLNQSITEKEKQLSSLAGEDPAATTIRAEIEKMRRRKAEQMLGEARKRVDRNPTDLQYRFELGEQLVLAGHYKDATPELQKARSNPNTRPRALYLLGKCYSELNRLDLAAKILTDAAAEIPGMDGTKKDIIYSLGQIYERMGDKEKSLECMKQIYDDPNSDIDDGPAGAPVPVKPSPMNPPTAGSAAKKLPPNQEDDA